MLVLWWNFDIFSEFYFIFDNFKIFTVPNPIFIKEV